MEELSAMTTDTPAIEIEDMCFGYETAEVLHNVNFRVEAGAFLALVGPNGGGKTTLLRLLLGLLTPRYGAIRGFGVAPEAARQRLGYVPQHIQFDPAFPVSVIDVVLLGRVDRHWFGPYRRSDRRTAMHALEQVDLEDMANHPFSDLSGGQRQRVLIAQALASEPELLLLDEPTANVDSLVQHKLFELLKELNQRLTILLVSHNLNVVTGYVSHVACVNRTVDVHPVRELTASVVHETYGGDLTILRHNFACQIINPDRSLHTPHQAEGQHRHPRPAEGASS
jgi:zinc transport system ATP-binding protein